MTVEFRLLGNVEAQVDGRAVDLGPIRQRCVLAALLVDVNHVVSTDQLFDRAWGGLTSLRAHGTLYSYLSRLRRALADAENVNIARKSGGYLLTTDPATVDLHLFRYRVTQARNTNDDERAAALLEQALQLWRDEAFAGIDTPWINTLRNTLEAERLAAELDCTDLRLRQGQHSELLADLSAHAAEHPLNERLAGQLMLACYRSGRQDKALDTYRQVRTLLDAELGVEPGPQLQQLHEAILRHDLQLHSGQPSVNVPRQLPSDITAFAGRRADLAALDALKETRAVVISAIHGTAGVGKTALAVHWSHHASDQFPDGQLYINLRGFDHDRPPVNPDEALGQLLRALGVDPHQIPHDVEERASRYRSMLAGKRVLIVLDNAVTEEWVRPLLPGTPTCMVLVTSRNKLAGLVAVDGAHNITLDVLDPVEAMTLLEKVLGRQRLTAEPTAAAELARLCGRLPLALRVASGKLVMNPKQKIAETVTALSESSRLAALEVEGDRRATVRAAFDLSFQALKPEEQLLFRRFGLIPGPDFTAPAAAALAGFSKETAMGLLDRLVSVYLVESPKPERFRLHDLLRLYASARCDTDESAGDSDDARRRLFDWYLTMTDTAAHLLYPQRRMLSHGSDARAVHQVFADKLDAWEWLEAERPNLLAAIDDAAERGMHAMVWRLVDSTRGFFMSRGYDHDWETTARLGLRAAEQAGDDRSQAAMHLNLGTSRWAIGDNQGFLDHSAQAVKFARRCRWRKAEAKALGNVGVAHTELGQPQRALEFLEHSLVIIRAMGSTPGEIAQAMKLVAHTNAEIGNLQQSQKYFDEALTLTRESSSLDDTEILYGLGWTYWQLGEPSHAEQSFTASLIGARRQGAQHREAYNLGALAEIACDAGRTIESDGLIQQALVLIREAGRTQTETAVLNAAGRISLSRHLWQPAVQYHQRAFEIARNVGYRYLETEALVGLARAHLGLRNYQDAVAFGEQALVLARKVGYRVLAGKALTALAEIELTEGSHDCGVNYARQALELHFFTGHRPGEDYTRRLLSEQPPT